MPTLLYSCHYRSEKTLRMEPMQNAFYVCSSAALGKIKILAGLLPIPIITLGALYLHDCPKQPNIPIYLVVGGVVCLLICILSFFSSGQQDLCKGALCSACKFILYLFGFCWFIAGSVWVYTIFPPNYESPHQEDYSYTACVFINI
ncbi:hypothetical protein AGOR_G00076230 [Albula goreensis]|uniref:Uncharacterized protein n=1 Tax=Albula goreensis TaxID=1534307 RepID=A0A8T3DSN4_9TELE|nr:hypothetical protein AGOR_G00076230 [Albula goreensis]